MNRLGLWSVIATTVALGFALPRSGSAFKRTKTCSANGAYECESGEDPKPISWPVRCVQYRINDRGSSDFDSRGELGDPLRSLVVRSFDTWNEQSCSDFQLVEGPTTSNATATYDEDAGYDGNMNLVVWRDDNWPYPESKFAFALTSVTYGSDEGTITDADLEINTDRYEFAHLSESKADDEDNTTVDLVNTLTHEVGHIVGLDHPPDQPEATMHGRAPLGEIKKRSLHQDDIDGLCAIYPSHDDSVQCDDPDDFVPPRAEDHGDTEAGLCSTSSSTTGRLPIAAAWLVLLAVGRWRRRSSGRRDATT